MFGFSILVRIRFGVRIFRVLGMGIQAFPSTFLHHIKPTSSDIPSPTSKNTLKK